MKRTAVFIGALAMLTATGAVAALAQSTTIVPGPTAKPIVPTVPPAVKTLSYGVKFTCGEFDKTRDPARPEDPEGPVKPGDYQTMINVHNPHFTAVNLRKKAVLLFAGDVAQPQTDFEVPRGPGQFRAVTLGPDFGFRIDCQDIRKVLLGGGPPAPVFIEGYVVIYSQSELDVDAVYTANGFNIVGSAGGTPPGITREGFSMDVEKISPIAA